ncbi:hypothetical protein T440DRAFT_498771 [Plenodomus tracheiphilus IPT5]|uniref:C2H2-type domain-containing protein n=1 Tax=Plenodomus tracheiphilus IPT5 TaxID=1408161 RepID=A0A6A7B9A0_9PLEO|nr:hypothetical protein T440DRAFT_498771 [Plenodomus tracheiphilus IPT5]
MPFHCGICEDSFATKSQLKRHTANHADINVPAKHCPVCNWPFDDQLALEAHQRASEHLVPLSSTDTAKEYNKHRSWPNGTCADFKKKSTPEKKVSPPIYVDHDKPNMAVQPPALGYSNVPSTVSEMKTVHEGMHPCNICKKVFRSQGQYNNHFMGCRPTLESSTKTPAMSARSSETPPATVPGLQPHILKVQVPPTIARDTTVQTPTPIQTITMKSKPPFQRQTVATPATVLAPMEVETTMLPATTAKSAVNVFACQKSGCGMVFKSAPALRVHDGDVHGIGSQKLDLHGRDSWMLGPRERERLRAEGLLRGSPNSTRGRGGRLPPPVDRTVAVRHPMAPKAPLAPLAPLAPRQVQVRPGPPPPSFNMPTVPRDGGPADMEQAKIVQGKILRLLIQSNIYITDQGKLIACGIEWTRIGTGVQHEVVGRIESMIHLPKVLQDEYMPFPKAFSEEYRYAYPPGDFKTSPTRDRMKPRLDAIAISCSKVVLEDGAQEVVKIAAVDLVTCRILMNNLVCTSPYADVADWRSESTGLSSWRDLEHARSSGYKIFRGWSAARSALHQFIDKNTIIVGHNLRSDLDALRMIHGRAIDVAKVYEKAADGPLSKTQLGLDSLSKNLMEKKLKDDPRYGRDVLMNAFAARQFVLWAFKNPEALKKAARQTSLDLQRAGFRG